MLDEPSAGVDPVVKRDMWRALRSEFVGGRRTLLFTTHDLDEADTFSDTVAVMARGRVRCAGSPAFLKRAYDACCRLTVTTSGGDAGEKDVDDEEEKLVAIARKHVPDARSEDIGGGTATGGALSPAEAPELTAGGVGDGASVGVTPAEAPAPAGGSSSSSVKREPAILVCRALFFRACPVGDIMISVGSRRKHVESLQLPRHARGQFGAVVRALSVEGGAERLSLDDTGLADVIVAIDAADADAAADDDSDSEARSRDDVSPKVLVSKQSSSNCHIGSVRTRRRRRRPRRRRCAARARVRGGR